MHLYRILKPDADFYDAGKYVSDVKKLIEDLHRQGITSIIEGSGVTYVSKLAREVPNLTVKIGLKWPENFDFAPLIRKRVEGAVRAGLLTETAEIISLGLESSSAFTNNPVYMAAARHLRGEITLEKMIDQITQDGVRISRWQYDHLKELPGIVWVESDPLNPDVTIKMVKEVIESNRKNVPLGSR